MKSMYMDNRFEFSDKGIFKMESELVGSIESKFKIDNKRKVIITEDINGRDEIAKGEMPYRFLNGELHLTMDPESFFILERVN